MGETREEWRDISGFEGLYQVSNNGKVRSLNRIYLQRSSTGGMMTKRYYGKELSPEDNGSGYLVVHLRKCGKRTSRHVHRLVAEAFIPKTNHGLVVNHKDYNKKNNKVSNLEWTTQRENVIHSASLMMKPKSVSKPTNTGEKYITKKRGRYRLNIQRKGMTVDVSFKTIEEAVRAREVITGGRQHYAG